MDGLILEIDKWKDEWLFVKNESVNVKTEWLIKNLSSTAEKFIAEKKVREENEFFDNELETMRREKIDCIKKQNLRKMTMKNGQCTRPLRTIIRSLLK